MTEKAVENNDQPQLNWGRFESMFGSGFPFQSGTPWGDPLDIEKLVAKSIRKKTSQVKTSISTKERYIHVKFTPPKEARPEDLRVFATRHEITLQGDEHFPAATVKLPAAVSLKKYQAVWRSGSLYLRLRKAYANDSKQELFIEY